MGGIALAIFGVVYSDVAVREYQLVHADVVAAKRALDIETQSLLIRAALDVRDRKILVNEADKLLRVTQAAPASYEGFKRDVNQSVVLCELVRIEPNWAAELADLKKRAESVSAKKGYFAYVEGRHKYLGFALAASFVIGLVIFLIGARWWYSKHQMLQDELLQIELEQRRNALRRRWTPNSNRR